MKKIFSLMVLTIAAAILVGCTSPEPESNVPQGTPGDGGPQPTQLQGAGGTGDAAAKPAETE